MKSTLIKSLMITIALVSALGLSVAAQTVDDISHVRDYISRNAELLQKAQELVSATNSTRARQSLEAAMKLHQQSISVLNAAATGQDVVRAASLAKKAREIILQTIAIAKRDARFEEAATKALERATDRLEHGRSLRSEITDRDLAQVDRLLREAHTQLQRSRDNIREHMYEVALRLAVSSEDLSNRAIRSMKRDTSDSGLIEREIAKTERLLERIGDQVDGGGDRQPARMLREALQIQKRAKESYRQGRPSAALDLTRQARRMGMQAAKTYSSQANDSSVEQALRLTDVLLEEARVVASDRRAEELNKQIERAAQIQKDAKRQFKNGNLEQAIGMTLRARRILKDALGAMKSDLGREDVEPALRGTDKLISRLKETLDDVDNDVAKELYERARAKQKQAWDEVDDRRFRAALAKTRLARNLANQAFRRIGYDM